MVLARVQDTPGQLSGRTYPDSSLMDSHQQVVSIYFGEGKHSPEGCGSCRRGHGNWIVFALPTIHALRSHSSCFCLELHPIFLSSRTWLFHLFPLFCHEDYVFHRYQVSGARILTGAPSAGGMTPLHGKTPLQGQAGDLSLFSFSLHELLTNKGMTLIKNIYAKY